MGGAGTVQIQLIDEDKKFNEKFDSALKEWGVVEKDYHLVAILGAQSSGKSTLLNAVFGTQFQVMDDLARSQTTHGIWMSHCKMGGGGSGVLVMDVEGTDGRERAEDQDFERKSALFSLATAEILIINMWEHAVGLYHGANMSLLKTILDVHLQLFKDYQIIPKTTLLFVIRDYIGLTPAENLRQTIMTDLGRIWDSLKKPDRFEGTGIEDVLGFEFAFLAHKILKPAQFGETVGLLAGRFELGKEDSFFGQEASMKIVPADGLALYMNGIWDMIVENKDLNLPNQQDLLAQYRCDDLSSKAFQSFVNKTEDLLTSQAAVNAFGHIANEHKQDCLNEFSLVAYRYSNLIFERKLLELSAKIDAHFYPAFVAQIQILKATLLAEFESTELGEDSFGEELKALQVNIKDQFDTSASACLIPCAAWNLKPFQDEMLTDLEALCTKAKEAKVNKERVKLLESFTTGLAEDCTLDKLVSQEDLWEALYARLIKVYEPLGQSYTSLLESLDLPSNEHFDQQVIKSLTSFLRSQLSESGTKTLLQFVFEDSFRYDESGRPRIWSQSIPIDTLYDTARHQAFTLLTTLTTLQFSHESDKPFGGLSLSLISEPRQETLRPALKRTFESIYMDAKRASISHATSIPWWVFVLLVVLGWNEFMAIIRSPFYLLILLIFVGGYVVLEMLGLRGLVIGHALAQIHRVSDVLLKPQPVARDNTKIAQK